MDKNKCKSCGEAPKKCSCKNKDFTKAVVEIDNPEQITLMRKVVIPSSMGDDTTVPPVVGKYRNVLLNYEANNKSYLYSSDGIPTLLNNGVTDYEAATNLPQINGNTLIGDKSAADLGLQSALTAGDGIEIENDTISISDIEQYAHFFDTVADMKAATNLIDGSYARTLGKYEANDGYGAYYKIGEVGEITLDNGLKAKLVDKPGDNNFIDINFTVARYNDTTCYITTIPYKDSHNKEIEIVPEIADEGVSPIQHARNINSSLTFNASAYVWHGSVIGNSTILNNADTSNLPTPFCYVGIKEDRTLVTYSRGTSANNMILDGCKQSWLAYWKLITNSTKEDFDQIEQDFLPGRTDLVNYPNPRQALGITDDKTIYLVSCDGRTSLDKGLTSDELADIMLSLGCVEAWNLDGGGSTSTVIKGYKVNKNIDSAGTVDRATTRIYASVKYDTTNDAVAKANSYAGKAIFENNNKLLPIIDQTIIKWQDNADLDNNATPQSVKLMAHIQNPITNIDSSMYVINLPHPWEKWYGKYACQLAFNRENNRAFSRRLVNSIYSRWEPLSGAKGMLYQRLDTFTSTADSTYEPCPLGEKIENSTGFINFDPENPTVFKIDSPNSNQLYKISYTVFVRTSTPGNKYVRIGRGATYVDNASISYSTVSERGEISGEFILSGIISTDELRLDVYGAIDDVWERPRIIIETI